MLNTPLDSTCLLLLTKRSNDIIYENFRRKEHRVSILPFPLQRQDYAELCALINILCLLLPIIGPVSSSFAISVSSRSAMTKKKKKKIDENILERDRCILSDGCPFLSVSQASFSNQLDKSSIVVYPW